MIRALQWQEANPIYAKAPTDWSNGTYVSVSRVHDDTKNKWFFTALKDIGVRNDWQPWERFFHADDLVIGYSYLCVHSIEFDPKPANQR